MKRIKKLSDLTPNIVLDLNRERIREIVIEGLHMTEEYIGDYTRRKKDILFDLDKILDIGMISTAFTLRVGCSKIPDLKFRIDPRRCKILGLSNLKKRVASLNHLLRAL